MRLWKWLQALEYCPQEETFFLLRDLKLSLTQLEKRLMARLDEVIEAIAEEKTVEQSAIALMQALTEQLASLKDSGGASADQLDSLIAQINDNKKALADAVAANTTTAPLSKASATTGPTSGQTPPAPIPDQSTQSQTATSGT